MGRLLRPQRRKSSRQQFSIFSAEKNVGLDFSAKNPKKPARKVVSRIPLLKPRFCYKKNGKYGIYNIETNVEQVPFEFDQIVFSRNKIEGVKLNETFLISIINNETKIEKL